MSTITMRTIETIDTTLDRIENRLPLIPRRVLRLQRTLVSAGCFVGRSAFSAFSSSSREVESSARTGVKTVAGQARAQTEATASLAEDEASSLLGRADRAVSGESTEELESWTKADLYERAQELDVEGRSTMSKDELVAALRAH